MVDGISLMIASCGRLAGAILGISFAFQAACSIEATAQEASAGSMNSGACSVNGAAFDLFGRHVAGGAHDVGGLLHGAELKDFGGAEIRDFHGVVGSEHDVRGLDVAMNDVAFMRELQGAAGLLHDAQDAGKGKGLAAIEMRLKAFAFDQLHGDVVEAVFFAGGAGFCLESDEELGTRKAGAFFAQFDGFDGYGATDDGVGRFVNDTHGAAAQFAANLVTSCF